MTQVFELAADVNEYWTFYSCDDSEGLPDAPRFPQSVVETWSIPQISIDKRNSLGNPAKEGDILGGLQELPIFKRSAADMLMSVLEGRGEFLPVKSSEGDYVCFNVTRAVPAVDMKNSEFSRVSSGTITRILKHYFIKELVEGETIFRTPQTGKRNVYVTDLFVDVVKQHNLQGFDFDLLWSSEGPKSEPPPPKPLWRKSPVATLDVHSSGVFVQPLFLTSGGLHLTWESPSKADLSNPRRIGRLILNALFLFKADVPQPDPVTLGVRGLAASSALYAGAGAHDVAEYERGLTVKCWVERIDSPTLDFDEETLSPGFHVTAEYSRKDVPDRVVILPIGASEADLGDAIVGLVG